VGQPFTGAVADQAQVSGNVPSQIIGEYCSHLAPDRAEPSCAITGKPVVDRKASGGANMKFTLNAPQAIHGDSIPSALTTLNPPDENQLRAHFPN
jgi:hypothetical protein